LQGVDLKATKSRPESRHAAQSKRLLAERCGGMLHQNHYIAGFQLPSGRQLAVERCGVGHYLWSEPCRDRIPPELHRAFRRAYAANEPRNADINGRTAPRLKRDRSAEYWLFDTLGDLERFVDVYATI
jgi:hypothetical protein